MPNLIRRGLTANMFARATGRSGDLAGVLKGKSPKELAAAKKRLESNLGPMTIMPRNRITKMGIPDNISYKFLRSGLSRNRPAIFAKGDMAARTKPDRIAMSPKNKEMVNRMTLLHEGSEGRATYMKKSKPIFGQEDPKVLMEEHNMVSTLPKENLEAKRFFRDMRRGSGETAAMRRVGLRYGSQGRLSPRMKQHYAEKLRESTGPKNIFKGMGRKPTASPVAAKGPMATKSIAANAPTIASAKPTTMLDRAKNWLSGWKNKLVVPSKPGLPSMVAKKQVDPAFGTMRTKFTARGP